MGLLVARLPIWLPITQTKQMALSLITSASCVLRFFQDPHHFEVALQDFANARLSTVFLTQFQDIG